jgi:hypothetical protein
MFWKNSVDKSLEKRIAMLEKDAAQLVEDRDMLRQEFRRLRGTVTGGRRLRIVDGDEAESIPFGDKDALRARAGLVAGKRYAPD